MSLSARVAALATKIAVELKVNRASSLIRSFGTVSSGSLDLSSYVNGGVFALTLGANLTSIALPTVTPTIAVVLELVISQDSVGSRTITFPAGVKSSEGNPPVLSTAINAIDTVALVWDGTRWKTRLVERALA